MYSAPIVHIPHQMAESTRKACVVWCSPQALCGAWSKEGYKRRPWLSLLSRSFPLGSWPISTWAWHAFPYEHLGYISLPNPPAPSATPWSYFWTRAAWGQDQRPWMHRLGGDLAAAGTHPVHGLYNGGTGMDGYVHLVPRTPCPQGHWWAVSKAQGPVRGLPRSLGLGLPDTIWDIQFNLSFR